MSPVFTQVQLEELASVLVDGQGGLTHKHVERYLASLHMIDDYVEGMPKRDRVYRAFARSFNLLQNDSVIVKFVEIACDPARFLSTPDVSEAFRQSVNEVVAFGGWEIGPDGRVRKSKAVTTLPEARRRARELRHDLVSRHVHPDVLAFCKEELLADDYFHVVLEASKSVFAKIRSKTGLDGDGTELVDRAFSSSTPLWIINSFESKSHRTEQSGFCNLLKGMYGMFRNPTAHEPRVSWPMSKEDAEDILSLLSMIHRRLDRISMPPRV